jgi:hypothetical protein
MTAVTASDANARAHAQVYLCMKCDDVGLPKSCRLLVSERPCGFEKWNPGFGRRRSPGLYPQGRGVSLLTLVACGAQAPKMALVIARRGHQERSPVAGCLKRLPLLAPYPQATESHSTASFDLPSTEI